MNKKQFLGASLHTGLKGIDGNGDVAELIAIDKCGYFSTDLDLESNEEELHEIEGNFKIIARPLSDLTKPITQNGETFVPMIKLLEMEQSLGLTYAMLNMKVTGVSCNKSDKFSTHNVEYTEPYTNMDDGIITFSYSEQFRRFGKVMRHPYRQPLSVGYQIDLFLKLIEWHFNLMDESEPFITVTNEFNPYK